MVLWHVVSLPELICELVLEFLFEILLAILLKVLNCSIDIVAVWRSVRFLLRGFSGLAFVNHDSSVISFFVHIPVRISVFIPSRLCQVIVTNQVLQEVVCRVLLLLLRLT